LSFLDPQIDRLISKIMKIKNQSYHPHTFLNVFLNALECLKRRFTMNLYLPHPGSKVNGLEQPIHNWRVYCHLLHVRDGVGGGGETGRV